MIRSYTPSARAEGADGKFMELLNSLPGLLVCLAAGGRRKSLRRREAAGVEAVILINN